MAQEQEGRDQGTAQVLVVTLSAAAEGAYTLAVADTGPGMPANRVSIGSALRGAFFEPQATSRPVPCLFVRTTHAAEAQVRAYQLEPGQRGKVVVTVRRDLHEDKDSAGGAVQGGTEAHVEIPAGALDPDGVPALLRHLDGVLWHASVLAPGICIQLRQAPA